MTLDKLSTMEQFGPPWLCRELYESDRLSTRESLGKDVVAKPYNF